MPSSPDRRWLASDADPPSRRRILDAALRLFVRHGLSATSIRMIGDEAGYTNPALFKFFASKEALALHVFERSYLWVYERLASAAEGTFQGALQRLLEASLELIDEDVEAVLFVQDSLRELWPRLPATRRRRSIVALLGDLIGRGIREGAVVGYRTPDVPMAALVGLLAQLARLLYFGEIARPARSHRQELARAVNRMLGG